MTYIREKMASVGVGSTDLTEIKTICDNFTDMQKDVLDSMHSLGAHITMKPVYSATRQRLISDFSDDDLTVLGAYISARRNIEEY